MVTVAAVAAAATAVATTIVMVPPADIGDLEDVFNQEIVLMTLAERKYWEVLPILCRECFAILGLERNRKGEILEL